MTMRTLFAAATMAALAVVFGPAQAAGGGPSGEYIEEPNIRLDDRSALQRGAKTFVNYCMGCHSAQYHRWMHVSEDLGIPDDVVKENFIWITDELGQKVQTGELMEIAMAEDYGEDAFGGMPPDLTLRARVRGEEWIYNFLRTFYLDDDSPTGVNNAVLDGTAMPHVLWELQGLQEPVYDDDEEEIVDFERVVEGSMSPEEYDRAMSDLTTFLSYLGEPAQLERRKMGAWVMLFLLVFLVFAYLLKREYWKDVH